VVNGIPLTDEHPSMPEHPESFPVNALVPIPGTPLEGNEVSAVSGILAVVNLTTSAGLIPYPSPDDSHCAYCSSRNYHQTRCREKHSQRVGASHVLHGGCQRCVYRREDVNNTL
jgi:biotin synthase-like enzyme